MTRGANRSRGRFLSTPSVVLVLSFILLGWIASHSIAYTLAGLMSHDHRDHHEWHIHGYMEALKLVGGGGFVLALGFALRSFFRHGSFGEWLREGGVAGTRQQIVLATLLPATVFVLIEHMERLIAGMGIPPSGRLLVVGVIIQVVVGLLCLMLVRVTFHVAERVIVSITQSLAVRYEQRARGLGSEGVFFVRLLCPMAGPVAGRAPPFWVVSC